MAMERAAAEQRMQAALAAAKEEAEGSLGRHLSFIDRLIADKDELTRQLGAMHDALKVPRDCLGRPVHRQGERGHRQLGRCKPKW